jgi:hypothetical protein
VVKPPRSLRSPIRHCAEAAKAESVATLPFTLNGSTESIPLPSWRAFDNSERDFSSRIFWFANKNKIQIFPCRFRERFLISSPLAGSKERWC